MPIQESISSALDAIRANKLRSILTTLAIIIGTAAVIAMVSMGSSAQKAIDESITDLGARTIYVYPSSTRQGATNTSNVPLDIKDALALAKDQEIDWQIAP
jgi:putative ABC transport system permease protein